MATIDKFGNYLIVFSIPTEKVPIRPRPETSSVLARRLVTGALGIKLDSNGEQMKLEREKLRLAKGLKYIPFDSTSLMFVFVFQKKRFNPKNKRRTFGMEMFLE